MLITHIRLKIQTILFRKVPQIIQTKILFQKVPKTILTVKRRSKKRMKI